MPSDLELSDRIYQEEQSELQRAQSEGVGPSSFLASVESQQVTREMLRDLADALREQREEFNRMVLGTYIPYTAMATGSGTNQTVRMADLYDRYPGPSGQPERQEERRQQMEISIKPKPLSPTERESVKTFLTGALTNGFARWPLPSGRLILHVDGIARFLYSDGSWNLSTEYLYIGRSQDDGSSGLGDPGARLAVLVAIMGAADLMDDGELLSLFEKRLAKLMAGLIDSATTPLASRDNGEPLARMAWTTDGRIAAWVDGGWVKPLTGEPVEVSPGDGWTVVETGEGRAVSRAEQPAIGSLRLQQGEEWLAEFNRGGNYHSEQLSDGRTWIRYNTIDGERGVIYHISERGFEGRLIAHQHQDSRWGITYPPMTAVTAPSEEEEWTPERFRQACVERDWTRIITLPDGRLAEYWSNSESETRRVIEAATEAGHRGLVMERDPEDNWVITYPRPIPTPPPLQPRQLLREDFDRWCSLHGFTLTQTADGRPVVAYSFMAERHVRTNYLPEALREGGPNLEVARDTRGHWGIAPVWTSAPSPDLADIETRFRQWVSEGWSTIETPDGRPSVSANDSRVRTQEWLQLLQPRLAGCVVEQDRNGNWAITYPLAQSGVQSSSESAPHREPVEDEVAF